MNAKISLTIRGWFATGARVWPILVARKLCCWIDRWRPAPVKLPRPLVVGRVAILNDRSIVLVYTSERRIKI